MIGVFNSGVGGLTVLNHFLKDLEQYDYIYLGDNANVPYGNKSAEVIYMYSQKAVDFLYAQGCRHNAQTHSGYCTGDQYRCTSPYPRNTAAKLSSRQGCRLE